MVNECFKRIFHGQQLFFCQIRTFKDGLLHPEAKALKGFYRTISYPIIANIKTNNAKHIFMKERSFNEILEREHTAPLLPATIHIIGGIGCE
jgi:hypothetical protein